MPPAPLWMADVWTAHSYLAVGACSKNAPHFIHLRLKVPGPDGDGHGDGGAEQKKKIVLIGKGVCFDSVRGLDTLSVHCCDASPITLPRCFREDTISRPAPAH